MSSGGGLIKSKIDKALVLKEVILAEKPEIYIYIYIYIILQFN